MRKSPNPKKRSKFLKLDAKKLLLHICCAPDATVPWPELISEGFETVGCFYGGNIHPKEEYEKRADSVSCLASHICSEFVMLPYEPQVWLEETYHLKDEPERGKRCELCFELQLKASAMYAAANGFTHLSTTLTISPHKNPELINRIGSEVSKAHGLIWVEKVWRKNNGFKRSVEESRRLGIYRQNYCGCIYSIQSR